MRAAFRGRRVVLAAALGVAAILVLAALQWREIAARFHERRLASRPELLLEMAAAPEGTARYQGLLRFIRTEKGATALVNSILEPPRTGQGRKSCSGGRRRFPRKPEGGLSLPE